MIKKGFFLCLLSFVLCNSIRCQESYSKLEKALEKLELNDVDSSLFFLQKTDTARLSDYDKALWHQYAANAFLIRNSFDKAYKNGMRAKTLFLEKNDLEQVSETNFILLEILQNGENNFEQSGILSELETYASSQNDPLISAKVFARMADQYLFADVGEKALYYYDKSISELQKIKDTLRIAKVEMNKGSVFFTVLFQLDSALYYYKKSLPVFKGKKLTSLVSYNYNNQAQVYKKQGQYAEAMKYYTLANDIDLKKYDATSRVLYYENLMELYKLMGDYKNAFLYAEKLKSADDSLNMTAQNIAISEIQTKYETAKKEKANLELKTKVEKKTRAQIILWIGLSLSLVVGFVVSYLILKNAKRKHLIAEQERELAIQKIEKNLKEQELNTIDLMISGQEKERQRLANDLHDNLGSTLAALKLNFKTIQRNFNAQEAKPIMENASVLIDDAYKKVREIAHEKNSGVMAEEGLLPAVEQLARKVSKAGGIQISVQGFGLKSRLENSLEIALFRIIQELITNIVKHSEATEASISLTNHTDYLNIIVEDNGKGFGPRAKKRKDGMGLSNIEKRIEHLDGSMEIDTSNKGTSIIIDLPL